MQAMHHNELAIDHNLVSAKAYEIWQSKGCPEGASEQIWLEAEQVLRAGAAANAAPQESPASQTIKTASAFDSSSRDTPSADSSEPPSSSRASAADESSEMSSSALNRNKKSSNGNLRRGRR
jgi:hypothetical protein